MTSNVIVTKESTSLISRSVLIVFCLAAGFAYRASVSLIPTGIFEDSFLFGLAALLLIVAVLTRRSQNLRTYWEIPFAFFIFTVAGFVGDVSISPLQQWFIRDVLHETPSVNNPLASTVVGTVLAQLFGTLSLALPIILLTKASGSGLNSIFINKERSWKWLVVGIIGFLVFFLFAAFGLSKSFFPNMSLIGNNIITSVSGAATRGQESTDIFIAPRIDVGCQSLCGFQGTPIAREDVADLALGNRHQRHDVHRDLRGGRILGQASYDLFSPRLNFCARSSHPTAGLFVFHDCPLMFVILRWVASAFCTPDFVVLKSLLGIAFS